MILAALSIGPPTRVGACSVSRRASRGSISGFLFPISVYSVWITAPFCLKNGHSIFPHQAQMASIILSSSSSTIKSSFFSLASSRNQSNLSSKSSVFHFPSVPAIGFIRTLSEVIIRCCSGVSETNAFPSPSSKSTVIYCHFCFMAFLNADSTSCSE